MSGLLFCGGGGHLGELAPPVPSDERFTPKAFFRPLAREFNLKLDVCATRESAKCRRYFTKEKDGLAQSWEGERVWCNPPWSDITPWIRKAWLEPAAVTVMLLPSWTDRDWWEKYIEPYRDGRNGGHGGPFYTDDLVTLDTRFLRQRIRFGRPGNPEGKGAGRPDFWCCLAIWRRE